MIRFFALLTTIAVAGTAADKNTVDQLREKAVALVGKPAPDFVRPDLDGRQVRLSDSRGRIVLLAFWATWCPPCRSELPHLAKLQREMANTGADVILVAYDDPAKARAFLVEKKLDVKCLLDQEGLAAAQFGARALPKAFIVSREGIVVKFLSKKQSEDDFRRAVEAARLAP